MRSQVGASAVQLGNVHRPCRPRRCRCRQQQRRRRRHEYTVSRISAAADQARANGWEVKAFGRPWNLPLSAIGEVFFSKVMWRADMMQVAVDAAHPPLHAWPDGKPDDSDGETE
ncbi:hypothetical protein [Streptomyces nigrescens]